MGLQQDKENKRRERERIRKEREEKQKRNKDRAKRAEELKKLEEEQMRIFEQKYNERMAAEERERQQHRGDFNVHDELHGMPPLDDNYDDVLGEFAHKYVNPSDKYKK